MIVNGLILYLCFIISLSFHECAHGWVASRCGDDTAKIMGRVTLNPMAHIDMLGTVILPMLMIFLPLMSSAGAAISGFVIGWAKPVPVNPNNFRHYHRDDNLVSLAGPVSNLLLAFVILIILRLLMSGLMMSGKVVNENSFMEGLLGTLTNLAMVNIVLAWFNLIPVPPLDGSHLLKNWTKMDLSTYVTLSRYGLIILILALNFTPLQKMLSYVVFFTFNLMLKIVGLA